MSAKTTLVCVCGAKYPAALLAAGSTFPCNQCGATITVPAIEGARMDAGAGGGGTPAAGPAAEPEAASEVREGRDRRTDDRRSGKERRSVHTPQEELPHGERREGPPDRRQIQRRLAERRKAIAEGEEGAAFKPRAYKAGGRSVLRLVLGVLLYGAFCAGLGGVFLGPVLLPLLRGRGDGAGGETAVSGSAGTVVTADWVKVAEVLTKQGYPEGALRLLEIEERGKGKLSEEGERVRRNARARVEIETRPVPGLDAALEDVVRIVSARESQRAALLEDFKARYKGQRSTRALQAVLQALQATAGVPEAAFPPPEPPEAGEGEGD